MNSKDLSNDKIKYLRDENMYNLTKKSGLGQLQLFTDTAIFSLNNQDLF